MELTVLEGNRLSLDGGAMFGNAPKELWKRWIEPDTFNRIPLASRVLLIRFAGRNILLEAGSGAFFDPKLRERYRIDSTPQLLHSLAQVGLREEDIDTVILSHLHFDHAGGLLSAYEPHTPFKLLFPNAHFYVSKEHWEYALNPHLRETASFIPQLHALLQESKRLILIEGSTHPALGFDISFTYSYGHTKGLMLSKIATETGPWLFASDLVPGKAWLHLPITMGYDRFPELLVDEKKQALTQLVQENGTILFCHDPHVASGKVGYEAGKFLVSDPTKC